MYALVVCSIFLRHHACNCRLQTLPLPEISSRRLRGHGVWPPWAYTNWLLLEHERLLFLVVIESYQINDQMSLIIVRISGIYLFFSSTSGEN